MKRLQTTLFVIAFVCIGTQSFRHVYVKWIEPRSSVLDAFRAPVDTAIASAGSLQALVAMYERAHRLVQEYERKPTNPEIPLHERSQTEPYASEMKLQAEIETWEEQTKHIFQLRFFWGLGLLSVVLGIWCHTRWNAWLGMAAIISGFSEMAYWTSPLTRSFGAVPEFERLLGNKLVLSLVTWALLVTLWLLVDKWSKPRTQGEGV
jgi:hypothetical protein